MSEPTLPQVGRNEPCPCGSGRKYKRCHGVDAAPKLTPPKADASANPFAAMAQAGASGAPSAMPGGMGAEGGMPPMDSALMMQFAQMMQRLPKGQLQRLQSIMQRAMAGKDVTREAREFEASLPPAFHDLLKNFQLPAMGALAGAAPGMPGLPEMGPAAQERPAQLAAPGEMTEEEARRLVAEAAAAGKISTEEAEKLGVDSTQAASSEGSAFSKFFRKKQK